MEQVEPGCVEFLDLEGVEDQERNWILSSLHSRNPHIQLPWPDTETLGYFEKQKVSPEVHHYPPVNTYIVPVYPPCFAAPLVQPVSNPVYKPHVSPVNYIAGSTAVVLGPVPAVPVVEDEPLPEYNTNGEDAGQTNGEAAEICNGTGDAPQRKSWASLFNKLKSEELTVPVNVSAPVVVKVEKKLVNNAHLLKEPFKSNADNPNLHRMGEFLTDYSLDNKVTSLQPRGLINRSNYCYINSILQAMLACPPVYNLLSGMAEFYSPNLEKKKITPTIDSVSKFVKEFHHLPAGLRVGRRLDKNQKKEQNVIVNCDTPFEPFWIHRLLTNLSDTFVVEGRQEDAEEFLGCLLNGLNDEMLELIKLAGGSVTVEPSPKTPIEEDKEWQVMGPKNKGSVTRRTELNRTPISDIFGGLIRSRLYRTGDQSTDNIQPFFTLQLNIEKANTVREALDILVCRNQLEGVTSSKTNEEVEAWQQVTLEELPIVLVLHLKCFDYKVDGCSKIIKALEFPVDLKIDMKLLSKTSYNPKERTYKLFAVVYHEGKEATKGHYVTDAYHVGYASWLRFDDASVKAVPEEQVLKPHGTRVPYLLFYRRSDAFAAVKPK